MLEIMIQKPSSSGAWAYNPFVAGPYFSVSSSSWSSQESAPELNQWICTHASKHMEATEKAAPDVGEMLFALHNMVLKTAWPRSLLESSVIQVTLVPGETSLQGANWPQHASHSVLYRKGVHLFGVKGVPPGNAGTSEKCLRIFIACGTNARLG